MVAACSWVTLVAVAGLIDTPVSRCLPTELSLPLHLEQLRVAFSLPPSAHLQLVRDPPGAHDLNAARYLPLTHYAVTDY